MPDDYGNFKGISVPAASWERIFGDRDPQRFYDGEAEMLDLLAAAELGDGGFLEASDG